MGNDSNERKQGAKVSGKTTSRSSRGWAARSHARSDGLNVGQVADVGRAIDCVINSGAAILFGGTRDGGAVVIQVLDGDSREKAYASTIEELTDTIDAICLAYSD